MLYNLKKIDDNVFTSQLDGLGRDVTEYYSNQKDRILVEPNATFDGGRIYCKKDSWIRRGSIISISDNWYLVSQLSNLASDVYNVGSITLCDVKLNVKLGQFVYEVPSVASKYSGSSNVRGIIDDSVEGKLSFITGYSPEFDQVDDNPYVVIFGKVWQIGDMMNVNNLVNVYCQGSENTPTAQVGMSPIKTIYNAGDTENVKFYLLNSADKNNEITFGTNNNNVAIIDKNGKIQFLRRGSVNITATCNSGAIYISPNITVR